MRRSSKPLPKDPNKLVYKIVQMSTDEDNSEETTTVPDQTQAEETIKAYLSLIGKKGGLKGGPARAKKLSAKKRKQIARKAAETRWGKKS